MPLTPRILAVLASLALFGASRAAAEDSRVLGRTSVAVAGSYGHEFVQGIDALGFGFGARGGYTFRFHLYLGGGFVYQLGSSERSTQLNYENHRNEYAVHFDAAYDFVLWKRWVIRLGAAAGLLVENTRTSVRDETTTGSSLYPYLSPIVATRVHFGRYFVGLDWRITCVPTHAFLSRIGTTGLLELGVTL